MCRTLFWLPNVRDLTASDDDFLKHGVNGQLNQLLSLGGKNDGLLNSFCGRTLRECGAGEQRVSCSVNLPFWTLASSDTNNCPLELSVPLEPTS